MRPTCGVDHPDLTRWQIGPSTWRGPTLFNDTAHHGPCSAGPFPPMGTSSNAAALYPQPAGRTVALRMAHRAPRAALMADLGGKSMEGSCGIARDKKEGVRWLRKTAEAGSTRGMEDRSWALERGNGVEAHAIAAALWPRKAEQAQAATRQRLGLKREDAGRASVSPSATGQSSRSCRRRQRQPSASSTCRASWVAGTGAAERTRNVSRRDRARR